jgi:hypothetical protein
MRPPNAGDRLALAELMLDAYRGTIDYEGEGMAEAVAEVDGYLADHALLERSVVLLSDDEIMSACLVSRVEDRTVVGYVMTSAANKERGLATLATAVALGSLQRAGTTLVDAWITEGNVPSERIFLGLGFAVVA